MVLRCDGRSIILTENLVSFFSDLEASIVAEAKVVEADLVKVEHFFIPLIEAAAAEIGKAALNAVLAAAPLVLTGQQKLSAAVASVQATLLASGKTAALGLIATAVQAAHDYVAGTAPKAAS